MHNSKWQKLTELELSHSTDVNGIHTVWAKIIGHSCTSLQYVHIDFFITQEAILSETNDDNLIILIEEKTQKEQKTKKNNKKKQQKTDNIK